MKKVIGLIFVLILLTSSWCSSILNECDETTAPEINFKFLVGGVVIIEDYVSHNDITSEYLDEWFDIYIYKIYCNGTERGPFIEAYSIGKDGILNRKGIGTWGFPMDNTEDWIKLEFKIGDISFGKYTIPYSMLQKYDNATAYFEFRIEWALEVDQTTRTFHPQSITLIN